MSFLGTEGYVDDQTILRTLKTRVRETAKRLTPYQDTAFDVLDIQRAVHKIDEIEEMTNDTTQMSTLPFHADNGYLAAHPARQGEIMAIIDDAQRDNTSKDK